MKDAFITAGMRKYSSHSFRRSGAQWAARCGLDVTDIKDIGRWVSLIHLERYVTEGKRMQEEILVETGATEDPIHSFWTFNRMTKLDSMLMSSGQLSGSSRLT